MLCFHTLSLACYHTSVWQIFYLVFSFSRQKVFSDVHLMYIRHKSYLKLYVQGSINFYRRPQVEHPWSNERLKLFDVLLNTVKIHRD